MRPAMPVRPVVFALLLSLLALPATAIAPAQADAGSGDRASAESVAGSGWLATVRDTVRDTVVSVWGTAWQILNGEPPGGKAAGAGVDPDGHAGRSTRSPAPDGD